MKCPKCNKEMVEKEVIFLMVDYKDNEYTDDEFESMLLSNDDLHVIDITEWDKTKQG